MSTQQGREPGVREKNRSGRGAVERGTLLAQASPHGGGRLSIVLSPHGLWAAVRACSRTVVRENNADWRSSRRPRMMAGARLASARVRGGDGATVIYTSPMGRAALAWAFRAHLWKHRRCCRLSSPPVVLVVHGKPLPGFARGERARGWGQSRREQKWHLVAIGVGTRAHAGEEARRVCA